MARGNFAVDITGQRFGMLTVKERMANSSRYTTVWFCKCDCGTESSVTGAALKSGKTKSCGCLRKERSPVESRFWSKVKRGQECWEWQAALFKTGYGKFNLNGKTVKSHRLSWELANGEIPSGLFVLHRCDNRLCVNPSHLFLGTNQDNTDDMWSKGRQQDYTNIVKGEDVGLSVFTESQVRNIRMAWGQGNHATIKEFAATLGLPYSSTWKIIRRETWKHLTDDA